LNAEAHGISAGSAGYKAVQMTTMVDIGYAALVMCRPLKRSTLTGDIS
jgi:hypothetical protein